MARLTETNFSSRRINLTEALTAAQAAYRDTCFRLEIGEANEATVTKAREDVATIEDRIAGLNAAWERTKAEIAADRLKTEAAARGAVVASVEKALAHRKDNAAKIDQAISHLASLYLEHVAAGENILEAVKPHAQHLGAGKYVDLCESLGRGHGKAFCDPGATILNAYAKATGSIVFGNHPHHVASFVAARDAVVAGHIEPLAASVDSEG